MYCRRSSDRDTVCDPPAGEVSNTGEVFLQPVLLYLSLDLYLHLYLDLYLSWAADAVNYLLEAGCFGDTYRCSDSTVLPNVVDELKKVEVNRELVRWLLTRTDIDQVRAVLTQSRPRTCQAPRLLHTTRHKGRARSDKAHGAEEPASSLIIAGPFRARPPRLSAQDDDP